MKILQSDRIGKISKLSSSTPSPPVVKVTTLHLSHTNSRNNGSQNVASSKNPIHQKRPANKKSLASLTTRNLRGKRDVRVSETECDNFTFTIKYENEYSVEADFYVNYQGRYYDYKDYRVTNSGLQVCNSSDTSIKQRWRDLIAKEKGVIASQHCNASVDGFYTSYILYKNFTVFFELTQQYFTRQDYGVILRGFAVCSRKLTLSCNDDLVKIKYSERFIVLQNFSLFYNNKMYDYREYRFSYDNLEICASNDPRILTIWKNRNSWEKSKDLYKCQGYRGLNPLLYAVNNQFTVYLADNGQYLTRSHYAVEDGEPHLCAENLRHQSTQYTQEDLSMCNDSTINIKYDDEYKVWKNFSIFYKNKVHDYTEYRVLNDGIRICNSTDDHERKIWKLRNWWVKEEMHFESCNELNNSVVLYRKYYTLNKQFTVYSGANSQYFTRNDYALQEGNLIICKEKLGPTSTEYTQEDLLMCNDSIITIKYDNEYKVWKNFSIFYKNKVYDYTEYRVLNYGIKICNSTNADIRKIWKVRNYWVKATMHEKTCNEPITYTEYHRQQYIVLKDFRVRIQKTDQVIQKYDYGVFEGKLEICNEKLFSYNANIKIIIAPLCALAISFISLLLLLIVYCMLPELRTLPGLNLMSLSFAFLLWQTYLVVFLSVYSRVGSLLTTPCATLFVTTKFLTYSILMNAAVNIYHLRKTFCGNTLVKSDVNKWRTFLRYSLFSWGIPVVVSIIYIVLINTGALRFEQYITLVKKDGLRFHESFENGKEGAKGDDVGIYQHISGNCINGRISPEWSAGVDVFGLQGCLLLYIIVMLIFTAYRIRKQLKASSSIAQKSNIRKNRKFLILFKLSTTTALSYWLPLFISRLVDLNFDVKIALYTVTLLTGAYIGFAFTFTRRNYTLLKRKYFPTKHRSITPAEEKQKK